MLTTNAQEDGYGYGFCRCGAPLVHLSHVECGDCWEKRMAAVFEEISAAIDAAKLLEIPDECEEAEDISLQITMPLVEVQLTCFLSSLDVLLADSAVDSPGDAYVTSSSWRGFL